MSIASRSWMVGAHRTVVATIFLLLLAIAGAFPRAAAAQAIVINHTNLHLFEEIPRTYVTAAEQMRMMYIGRSVGNNINQGLDCLSVLQSSSPNACRTTYPGGPAENWTGTYSRANWTYYGWPNLGLPNPVSCNGFNGLWSGYQPCFLSFTQPRMSQWEVMSFQFDYLTGIGGNLPDYFLTDPSNRDVYDFDSFSRSIAPKQVLYWTTSLMTSDEAFPGTLARLNEFNVALRSWVGQSPDRMLVDLADIVSHRPDGSLCTRNGYPRTCDEYSGEETGGHLTSGWSKVRAAKAFWIAMARLAGWNPQDHQSEDVPDPPANLRIATN